MVNNGNNNIINMSGWWGTWLLCFNMLGIIIPTYAHIFQRGRFKPPTRRVYLSLHNLMCVNICRNMICVCVICDFFCRFRPRTEDHFLQKTWTCHINTYINLIKPHIIAIFSIKSLMVNWISGGEELRTHWRYLN